MSVFRIRTKQKCVVPSITRAEQDGVNTILVYWNANDVNNGEKNSINVQMSLNAGETYTTIYTANDLTSPVRINSDALQNVNKSDKAIQLRLQTSSGKCGVLNSNVYDMVMKYQPNPQLYWYKGSYGTDQANIVGNEDAVGFYANADSENIKTITIEHYVDGELRKTFDKTPMIYNIHEVEHGLNEYKGKFEYNDGTILYSNKLVYQYAVEDGGIIVVEPETPVNTEIMFVGHLENRLVIEPNKFEDSFVLVATVDERVNGRWFINDVEFRPELGDRNLSQIPVNTSGTKNITFRVGNKISNTLELVVNRGVFTGSSGGGGGCPTLEETLLISENGETALVKDIVVGSTIYTKNDKTNKWEYATVETFKDTLQPVYRYVLDNGVEVEVSDSHAFKTDHSDISYHTYDTMQKLGSKILDANGEVREIVSREFVGEKMVRSYEIVPSHTYIVKGLLSHNVRKIDNDRIPDMIKEMY